MNQSEPSALLLSRQLKGKHLLLNQKNLQKNPVEGFSAGLVEDDIYELFLFIYYYYYGLNSGRFLLLDLKTHYKPPTMIFETEMYHPNVYPDGTVCISILHPPGDDKYGYEQASERWSPVHTVETILLSVISMLSSPNDESPANIEAAKEYRDNYPQFKKKVFRLVRQSAEMM
ncbi:hypothetical protein INT47_011602 [Mucor saturninus]|uniref:UBC core domain-containing protein n=1 Tax=Mucor saturninus TaxID=64648 RepID=A0A8H7R410_9FUNG|nr:hypothetical protein INT47_011602 [Mucor saturninus]